MLKQIDLKRISKIIVIASVILFAIYLFNYFEISRLANRENIELYLKSFGAWIPLAYLLIFITAISFYAPASVFLITIGTLLGPVWGPFWGIIGCYLASAIIFIAARKIGLNSVQAKFGNRWEKFNQKIEEDGFFYVALIRASSLFPFAVVCYGAAITTIKSRDYVKGTLIGCIPQILVYCYVVPMVISQTISIRSIVILSISALLWVAVFALLYFMSKKQKNILKSIPFD